MTMPPPPPDRMHLQYQPAPPPQPAPQTGPGGAYGPAQYSPDQPLPGQLPPAGLSMGKPGTVTGIQVILYIFLAVSTIGNVFSIFSMVEFFNPFSLIGLAFAVYSAIQSLASGVQIARGKRWAWIWSLVSAILGLVLSAVAIVFGIIYIELAYWSLIIGVVLAGLYGTLLGLLCSKSARQWILMHRIQRGEVQVPGTAMGGMAPMGGMAAPQGPAERPATRPGAATFLVVLLWLAVALSIWGIVNLLRIAQSFAANFDSYSVFDGFFLAGSIPPVIELGVQMVTLIGALICAPLIMKGKAGGRIFGVIWSIVCVLGTGFLLAFVFVDYANGYYDFPPLPGQMNPAVPAFGWGIGDFVLALTIFVLLLVPGVREWTPAKPATALIMMVPMGGQQAPQQPGPYGQQPGYPPQQQQPPYPPQY
ncbi:hypothetical protein [Glycomyces sp. NPDC048151]|uniref:hypothetical protein n=1 Tax=Glycomyces sp. NPDC048151 TaxID=3364002 RepID=UPI00370FD188